MEKIRTSIKQIQRIGTPVRSKYSMIADSIQSPTSDWGYVKGGDIAAGLAAGLKGYLGMRGALEDARNQYAYNENQALLAEQERQDNLAQADRNERFKYMSIGINPDRLSEEGYIDEALAQRANGGPKGEFGYIMAELSRPDFQTKYTPEQQKLLQDRAKSMAKGLDYAYNEAYNSALGRGEGQLRNAQALSTAEAIGRNLLTQNPNGELTPIKGTKEEAGREEKKQNYLNSMRSNLEKSDVILSYIDQALDILNKNPLAAGYGSYIGKINPYSDAGKLQSLLASIKGNVGLKQLIESKAEGATYGALSEKELQMLQDVMGSLNQNQNPAVLTQVLNNVRNNYQNVRNRAYSALQGGEPQQAQTVSQPSNLDDLWNSIPGGNNATR